MPSNPFVRPQEQIPVEDPRGWYRNTGTMLFIAALVGMVFVWFYFVLNFVVSGSSSINKDFVEAYLMGDPWNGKILYKNISTAMTIDFGIYNTQTEEYKQFASYKIDVDPFYQYDYIGDNKVVLNDYTKKYPVTYYFDGAGNTINMANTNDNAPEQPNRKYYFRKVNDDINTGVGEKGFEDQEEGLSGPDLKAMEVTDFVGFAGLEHSYWATDNYARKPIKDAQGTHLVLVEMKNQVSSNSTTSFFALINRENMQLKLTGYPNNMVRGASYLNGYFLNCRQTDADHIVCLTRDKVLKVQISTCKIEELATW